MKCGGCESQVQEAVCALPGVDSATASHKDSSAEISYDEAKTSAEAIQKAIEAKGFKVG